MATLPMGVRVRYAPSPTGSQHVGGARTALFNMLFARRHQGRFVLRIEDTDQSRRIEGALEAIVDALQWLGVRWDEGPDRGGAYGPYLQSERLDLYRREARRLEAEGLAYPCYCSPAELEEARQRARAEHRPPGYDGRCRTLSEEERRMRREAGRPEALRLDVRRVAGPLREVVVEDLIRGRVSFDLSVLDDFVILKSDGVATYNFAAAVDDHAMAISHVIRGDEHLSNTPRQILACRALGYAPPQFAHLSMVLAPDRSKLSKRHGATGVEEFRAQGYLPEALANYLLLLGWSHPSERELFSLDEAAEVFDLDRVSRTAAVYDVRKLAWMNGMYLRLLPAEEIADRVRPFLRALGVDETQLQDTAALVRRVILTRERAQTLSELAQALQYFYQEVEEYDPGGARKHFLAPGAEVMLRSALTAVRRAAAAGFSETGLGAAFDEEAQALGVPRARLIHPTRLAVTGRTVGPGLFELLCELGPETVERRLQRALAHVTALRAS